MENLQFIEQYFIVVSFCSSLSLLGLVLPLPFSTADVSQFLDTVLCKILDITSDHSCRCKKKSIFNYKKSMQILQPFSEGATRGVP